MAQLKTFFDLMNELSMKSDKKLPNLKVPVKGKKGVSKFMRKKLASTSKDDINASVQSADRKPEKYMKPDGKMGIRMVKTDKEVIKKESVGKTAGDKSYYHLQRAKELAKKDGHDYDKLPKYDRAKPHQDHYHDKAKNEASVLKPTKPTDIIKHAKTLAKSPRDYMMNKKKYLDKARAKVFKMYPKEEVEEAKTFDYFDSKDSAAAHAKKHGGKVFVNTGKGATKVKGKPVNTHVVIKKEAVEYPHMMYDPKTGKEVKAKTPADHEKYTKMGYTHEKPKMDEALNLQQRMKRSRLMKRMKTRIAIGRKRASRKMANKKTLEKRSMRQARNEIAKKLTRGIPKGELTFARKKEIEKRLEKPALQQRIKRLAKRKFKDVRKKEVQRKKG